MPPIVENLVVSVTVGIVTAYVTVRLSVRQFRTQKWWERRARAYGLLMESLHYMKTANERVLDSYETMENVDRESGWYKEAMKRQRKAFDYFDRMASTSEFLLCRRATEVTSKLKATKDAIRLALDTHKTDDYGACSDELGAIKECLRILPTIARRDLQLD